MSIASSTNSSENLTPDERLMLQSGIRNEPQGEESSHDTIGYDNFREHHKQLAQRLTSSGLVDCSHLHHYHLSGNNNHNNLTGPAVVKVGRGDSSSSSYSPNGSIHYSVNQSSNPLYENSQHSKFVSNKLKNFSTVLELPRSSSSTSKLINNSTSTAALCHSNSGNNLVAYNNLPVYSTVACNGANAMTSRCSYSSPAGTASPGSISQHLNQHSNAISQTHCSSSSSSSHLSAQPSSSDTFAHIYGKSSSLDHYANLPPPPPQYGIQHHNHHSNHPQHSSHETLTAFTKSGNFGNQQACNNSNNSVVMMSNNNGICLMESHSSNGSRSCSTTPESKSNERLSIFSKSQPDLSRLDEDSSSSVHACNQELYMNTPSVSSHLDGQKFNANDVLKAENTFLKSELESCLKKVSKLKNFEQEIQKVHQMYEDLMQSSEKKEKLERAVRYKLEIEIKRLQQLNGNLKEQMNVALNSASSHQSDSTAIANDAAAKEELQKTDILIGQLLTQNKELMSVKERQDIELQAQRLTLEEQRKHIEILDSALMNAQNNVVALEANLRKKMAYEERANHLQKALANLQLTLERRIQLEKRGRIQLEKEIEMLKSNEKNEKREKNNSSGNSAETELESLKKLTREYEEKIITLESEVSKWEQKYLEENTMRQIEVNAASVPKDAKIAALEKTSQQTEKLIAEARSERLKHMDELHEASKRTAELEAKMKDLESKLVERDAMIKVLQQHSMNRDNVLQQSILAQRSTLGRHTRSVSSMGLVNASSTASLAISRNLKNLSMNGTNGSNTVTKFTERSGSTSTAPSCSSYSFSSGQSSIGSTNSSSTEKKTAANLDEQLKELDKRLTNKDSIIQALRSERERYPNHFWKI